MIFHDTQLKKALKSKKQNTTLNKYNALWLRQYQGTSSWPLELC